MRFFFFFLGPFLRTVPVWMKKIASATQSLQCAQMIFAVRPAFIFVALHRPPFFFFFRKWMPILVLKPKPSMNNSKRNLLQVSCWWSNITWNVKTREPSLNMNVAAHELKNCRKVTQTSSRWDVRQIREEVMGAMCVRGQFGCSGGKRGMGLHPPGILDRHLFSSLCQWEIALLSICVQIRAQGSTCHLDRFSASPAGRKRSQRQTFARLKGGGDLESGTRKHVRDHFQQREDNLREDTWILFHLFFFFWRM